MSTRSDEQHETNAPQREGGGTAKRKRSRPWGLLALAFALGLLMWSCIPKGYLISSSVDELSTGEAVIAIRMGEARSQSWKHRFMTAGSCFSMLKAISKARSVAMIQ